MYLHRDCVRGVCACRVALSIMQSVPWPSLLCPAHVLPSGCSHLWLLIREMTLFHTHRLTLKPNTGQQNNLLLSPETHRSDGSITNSLIESFCFPHTHTRITHNCCDRGCLVVYCNVGVWILQSETEFTRMEGDTSLRVSSLLVSRMQRTAGSDRGWGKLAECVWVLSPCGVIVDRDGSRSGWGQRRGNTSSHHRTRG